jgi:glycosyltransferase involved in cell wall biosynthesis
MMWMKQIYHLLRNTLLYLFSARKRTYASTSEKCLYLDLRSNPFDRYLHLLLIFFALEGYQIRIRWRWGFWSAWSTSQICDMLGQFKLVWHQPNHIDIIFTDRNDIPDSIFLDVDYFTALQNGPEKSSFFIPMPMVDSMYYFDLHQSDININNRMNTVLFVGRSGTYNQGYNDKVFGIEDRDEVISTLRHSNLSLVDSIDLWDVQTDVVLQDRSAKNINPQQWRTFLAEFDFFLALPGYVMPHSHNIVEAMSVGCIPILAYAAWMVPALQHGINCIVYDHGKIEEAINYARSLDSRVIEQMRQNVFIYYQSHLEVSSVIKKIEDHSDLKKVYLTGEYNSTFKFMQHQKMSHGV